RLRPVDDGGIGPVTYLGCVTDDTGGGQPLECVDGDAALRSSPLVVTVAAGCGAIGTGDGLDQPVPAPLQFLKLSPDRIELPLGRLQTAKYLPARGIVDDLLHGGHALLGRCQRGAAFVRLLLAALAAAFGLDDKLVGELQSVARLEQPSFLIDPCGRGAPVAPPQAAQASEPAGP